MSRFPYTDEQLADMELSDLDAAWEKHLNRCDTCNYDLENCPCEWVDEVFGPDDHRCNCPHGGAGRRLHTALIEARRAAEPTLAEYEQYIRGQVATAGSFAPNIVRDLLAEIDQLRAAAQHVVDRYADDDFRTANLDEAIGALAASADGLSPVGTVARDAENYQEGWNEGYTAGHAAGLAERRDAASGAA